MNRALPEDQLFQDTRLTHSVTPGRLTEWTEPDRPIPVQAQGSIVPLVVPLPDGKAYAFARTYREVETKANRLLGNLFDGKRWCERPSLLARMSDIEGDDRRMSAVLDARSGIVHLVYIDAEGTLRHRRLSAPYREENWQPALPQPGTLVCAAPVYCAVASLDSHVAPSRVCLVFGRELQAGRDPRRRTGELGLAVFDGSAWTVAEQLVSEPGSTNNWYPNVAAEVTPDGELGVLYFQGVEEESYRARFALLRVRPIKARSGILFRERFDDAKLLSRGWYGSFE